MSAAAHFEFLRSLVEPLPYAAFFGALVLFGSLALAAARRAADPRIGRRTASGTTARFRPLDLVYSTPIMLVVVPAFGIPPVAVLVFEIVFNRANIRMPEKLNRVLAWVLVTPEVHRVHHSVLPRESDSNFGVTVTWWDRICGTYRTSPTEELATMRLGLEECRDSRTTSLSWLLALPLIRRAPVGANRRNGAVAAASARGAEAV